MKYDKLTRDCSRIVAIGIPAPRAAWSAEILLDPAMHLSGKLGATDESDDVLSHIYLIHRDMPLPELENGQSHGPAEPEIDRKNGEVRWYRRPVDARAGNETTRKPSLTGRVLQILASAGRRK